MSPLRPLAIATLALFLGSAAFAQLPQAGDTTSPPNETKGHDYLQAPDETVNPANGSVSIRIPLRISSGRELTLPLYVSYDSAGAFYYGLGSNTGAPNWQTTTNVSFTKGGWSYSLPMLTYSTESWTAESDTGARYTCVAGVNYVFQDATGNRHNMGLAPVGSTPGGSTWCGGPGTTAGGEGPISALTQAQYPCCAASMVTDGNGTVYSFPGGAGGFFPTSITDRNGNTVSVSVSGTPPTSATITDTLDRTAAHRKFWWEP